MDSLTQTQSIYAYGTLFLQKYDTDGNLINTHIIDGEASVTGMFCDEEGNVYLYGKYISSLNFWGELILQTMGVTANYFYVKIDENGNVLWGKNMSELHEFFSNFETAISDGLGNSYVGYDTWSDSYISKMNSDGEIISTIFQADVRSISGLAMDEEGNLIATGSCASTLSSFNGVSF